MQRLEGVQQVSEQVVSSDSVLLAVKRAYADGLAVKRAYADGVAQRLLNFAVALCAAVPCNRCCDNPECSNMSGLSKLQLVGGKSCVHAG